MNINSSISHREFQLLTALADRGKTLFTVQDAREISGVSSPYLNLLLQRLTYKRILERVERGVYLYIPIEAGSQRVFSEDAFEVGCTLARPSAVAYWSALSHHGLTEQISNVVFMATTAARFDAEPEALGVRYRFIRVIPRKFFGLQPVQRGKGQAQVTDLHKTLLDVLDHPEYAGGMVEVAKSVFTAWPDVSLEKLLEYGDRLGNSAVFKRLGFLLERFGLMSEEYPELLRRRIRRGLSKLEPLNPMAGHCCTRWGLRINMELEDLDKWRAS